MPLDPRTREELERRGVSSVTLTLADAASAGPGRNAEIRLFTPNVPNPTREDVEAWVNEKNLAAAAKEERRHKRDLCIAGCTLFVTVVAAGAALIAAWPVVQPWLAR